MKSSIFLQGSRVGTTLSLWPDIEAKEGSHGPEAALASRSAQPVPARENPTNGTSGPSSSHSSRSAPPVSCSGSKSPRLSLSERLGDVLKRRTARFGSMEYSQTWNRRATPQGRVFWAHTASARRILDSDCIGWAPPRAEDAESSGMRHGRGVADTLTAQASLAGWPTASARDYKDTPGMATEGTNPDGSTRSRLDQLPRVAQLCVIGRPVSPENPPTHGQTTIAGWATPMAGTPAQNGNNAAGNSDYSRMVMRVATGTAPTGSSAATGSTAGFQLNPHFSLWLMGYPTSWHDAGASALRSSREPATQSCPKSQPSSSAP